MSDNPFEVSNSKKDTSAFISKDNQKSKADTYTDKGKISASDQQAVSELSKLVSDPLKKGDMQKVVSNLEMIKKIKKEGKTMSSEDIEKIKLSTTKKKKKYYESFWFWFIIIVILAFII